MYAIDKEETFNQCLMWKNMSNEITESPIILVGNKSDLEHERSVPIETGKRFAEENKMEFFETSA